MRLLHNPVAQFLSAMQGDPVLVRDTLQAKLESPIRPLKPLKHDPHVPGVEKHSILFNL